MQVSDKPVMAPLRCCTTSDGGAKVGMHIAAHSLAAMVLANLLVSVAPGDLNGDGAINEADLRLFATAWTDAHAGREWPALADLAEPRGVLNWADAERMLCAFVQSAVAPEPTHYVSPEGDDSWPGTRLRPWRTVQHACEMAAPGDVIRILSGTYREDVILQHGGSQDLPVTLVGNGATIEGSVTLSQGVGHVILEGFEVHQSGTAWCISLVGSNSHIVLRRVSTSGGDCGLHFTVGEHGSPRYGGVEDVLVEDCVFTGAEWTGIDATPGPVQRLTIRRCTVSANGNAAAGFGADGIAIEMGDHIVVEDCLVAANSSDGIDLCSRDRSPREEVVVRRCRIFGNHGDGIKLWHGGRIENCLITAQGLVPIVLVGDARYEIVNCTVARNFRDVKAYAFTAAYPDQDNPEGRATVYLYNCIFAFNGPPSDPTGVYVGPRVTLTEDANCFFSRPDEELCIDRPDGPLSVSREDIVSGRWALTGGQHTFSADPRFCGLDDYRLADASPCLGRGLTEVAPAEDIDGALRLGAVDLGCYQMAR